MPQERKILCSWKELANYVGKSVRTLQRYECRLGFPIRRPDGKNRSSVMALVAEVDLWLRSNSRKDSPDRAPRPEQEQKQKILNSWSEIAEYVSRGVRTVQRYGSSLGFPVHHATGRNRRAVIAFTEEIDAWLVSNCRGKVSPASRRLGLSSVRQQARQSREHAMRLRQDVKRQQSEMRNVMRRLDRMRAKLAQEGSTSQQSPTQLKAS
jgi:hypothetical protein